MLLEIDYRPQGPVQPILSGIDEHLKNRAIIILVQTDLTIITSIIDLAI